MRPTSVYIDRENHRLHLARFERPGKPVLLLHGAVENGRIFYSSSGKGFAPFLAKHGYDVFVADLRGRGLSEPAIASGHTYGQHESITDELPAFVEKIRSLRGETAPIIWGAHSWGGVLMLSALARRPDLMPEKMVFFGTKRSVRVWNHERLLKISLFWNHLAPMIAKRYGYLPATKFGWGSDNETVNSLSESVAWVKPSPWVDRTDGFDYGAVVPKLKLPPILHLAGANDLTLGNPKDVKRLMDETGLHQPQELLVLGKDSGFKHDYDHISMLTHSDAAEDHFPRVVQWIER